MLQGVLDKNHYGSSAYGLVHSCYEVSLIWTRTDCWTLFFTFCFCFEYFCFFVNSSHNSSWYSSWTHWDEEKMLTDPFSSLLVNSSMSKSAGKSWVVGFLADVKLRSLVNPVQVICLVLFSPHINSAICCSYMEVGCLPSCSQHWPGCSPLSSLTVASLLESRIFSVLRR